MPIYMMQKAKKFKKIENIFFYSFVLNLLDPSVVHLCTFSRFKISEPRNDKQTKREIKFSNQVYF